MNYNKIVLDNGLRVITIPVQNTRAVTALVLVGAGSKYENKKNNGVSHFLEHMMFKGTEKRPSKRDIAEDLDKIGGGYNAFTSKEFTGYFAKVGSQHLELALDWVSDIFLNSKLPEQEIEKERGVIMEELKMQLDTPMEYIDDLWEKLVYGDQPAGWKTIGSKENIETLNRRDIKKYMDEHYTGSNTVVCIAGNFNEENAISKLQYHFKNIPTYVSKGKKKTREYQQEPAVLLHQKDTDQSHIHLGVRGYDIFDEKKYSQSLLSIILGGNMSSRLFMSIREEHGLAYYVRTGAEEYTDSGYLVTGAGVPHENIEDTIDLILKDYKDIREKGVGEEELRKAKDYIKGQMALSLESSTARANFYGFQEILAGAVLTMEEKIDKIEKVSLEEIKEAAANIFKPEGLNLAIIGPRQEEKKFKNLLRELS